MSGEIAGTGRKTAILWAVSLIATALVTLFATLNIQNASFMNSSGSVQKQALVSEMRLNLMYSSGKEKYAVMSTSDEESASFAEQSKTAARAVDRDLKKLEKITAKSGTDKEKELVRQFAGSWEEVQKIDSGLLESAVQNTNIKALGLSNTICIELQRKIDDDLIKLTDKVNPEMRKTQMDNLATDARLSVRTIALLQLRHIEAADETGKKSIETSIKAEQGKVNAVLKTLDRMTGRKSRVFIREAISDFNEFMRVNDEIVRLSTLNTNKSTVEISLNKKRMAETGCDRSLEALQRLSAGKP
jgi:hypothetical protein